uniref:Odorant receptor n=1 Tax=Adelphocoris lineolatus TaxID=236346 RepID=A0A2I4PH78_ADELI|nr:olfactory receptor 81 [Adelphocoris lineolatus]
MDRPSDPTRSNGPKFKAFDRLEKWQRSGYKLLLYGMSAKRFMKSSSQRAVVYLVVVMTLGLYSLHELIAALFFSRSLLEGISHAYIMTYILTFLIQWFYMLQHVRSFHENEIYLEKFESTQAHSSFADHILDRNMKDFLKYIMFCAGWWATNNFTHLIGPLIEFSLAFIRTGEFIQISLLPQVFDLPKWGQVAMYIHNAVMTFSFFMYCGANSLILGTRVLKVKTQCDILNEALRNDHGVESNIKAFIKDHIVILRAAKMLNGELADLNLVIFTGSYMEIATQMFTLTLFEPSGVYFFAVAFDFGSIFLITATQCWLSSTLTIALDTVSDGVYDTEWYGRDKNHALNVLIMLQMAQQEKSHRIWFNSFKIDRSAALSLLQSSYAVYTFLMIVQSN